MLYCQLLNCVMENLLSSPRTWNATCSLRHVHRLVSFMLSSLDKLSSNLSKEQFKETRKYLESLYVQRLNQPQTNIMTEG